MCIATLSVSTLSCQHRWYTLLSPCTPGFDLSNCPSRLQISGWEQKTDSCPWCTSLDGDMMFGSLDADKIETGKYRLFGPERGSTGNASAAIQRRRSSGGSSVTPERRDYRSNSTESPIPPSLGERNRKQNLRIESYLGYAADIISQNNRKADEDDTVEGTPISRSTTGGSSGTMSEDEPRKGGWKKMKKMGKGWFK